MSVCVCVCGWVSTLCTWRRRHPPIAPFLWSSVTPGTEPTAVSAMFQPGPSSSGEPINHCTDILRQMSSIRPKSVLISVDIKWKQCKHAFFPAGCEMRSNKVRINMCGVRTTEVHGKLFAGDRLFDAVCGLPLLLMDWMGSFILWITLYLCTVPNSTELQHHPVIPRHDAISVGMWIKSMRQSTWQI